jgi:hypothetical protein
MPNRIFTVIYLESSLIARVAVESFELDSSRTVLPPLFGLSVPETRDRDLFDDLLVDAFVSADPGSVDTIPSCGGHRTGVHGRRIVLRAVCRQSQS